MGQMETSLHLPGMHKYVTQFVNEEQTRNFLCYPRFFSSPSHYRCICRTVRAGYCGFKHAAWHEA